MWFFVHSTNAVELLFEVTLLAVSYLWRTRSEGVNDYLCNRMYTLPDEQVVGLPPSFHQLPTPLFPLSSPPSPLSPLSSSHHSSVFSPLSSLPSPLSHRSFLPSPLSALPRNTPRVFAWGLQRPHEVCLCRSMVPDQTVMYDICRCHSNQPYITERYLSQTITLLIQRPNASLERTIIEFCARSLRLGTKVCWLLSAAAGDSKHPVGRCRLTPV